MRLPFRRLPALNRPRDSSRDRADDRRAYDDTESLPSRDRFLSRRQNTLVLIIIGFALPERGSRDSGLLARLKEPSRGESNWNSEQKTGGSRRIRDVKRDRGENRDDDHHPRAAPATIGYSRSYVVDMLRHRDLTSAALRERSLWLSGTWKQIARGASLWTRAHAVPS